MAKNPAKYTRALTIAISNNFYEVMTKHKVEDDMSYSKMVRAGLKLYFKNKGIDITKRPSGEHESD